MMDSLQRRALLVVGFFLFLHLAALMIAPTYVWGVDQLRYLSGWDIGLFVLFGIVLLVPQGRSAMLQLAYRLDCLSDLQLELSIVIIGIFLFVSFPSATDLLGDGALYIRELDRGVYDAIERTDRAPLSFWLIRNLHEWLQAESAADTFRVYSSMFGAVYLGLVLPASRLLDSDRLQRSILAGFLLSGGFVPIFFGYAETYAPVLPVLLIYAMVGIRALTQKGSLLLPAAVAGLAAALHVAMVMLFPSLVVLTLLRFGWSWRSVLRMVDAVLVAMGVFVGFLLALGISPYRIFISGGHALLPLWGESGFHHPYALFSFLHGLDFLNVYLLTAPGALLAFWFVSKRDVLSSVGVFLGAMALFSVAFTVLANFEIGAFRDWDIQALSALPLTIWAGWLFSRCVKDVQVGLLVCGAAFLHTGIWVGMQAQPNASVARYASLLERGALSVHARSYGWETLAHHYRANEEYDPMLAAYQNALNANPENPRQWALLGDMYFKLDRFSEAIVAFGEATRRNPDLFQAFVLKGHAHFYLREYGKAIESYERVLALHPDMTDVYYNLAQVYQALGNENEVRRYMGLAEQLERGSQ